MHHNRKDSQMRLKWLRPVAALCALAAVTQLAWPGGASLRAAALVAPLRGRLAGPVL